MREWRDFKQPELADRTVTRLEIARRLREVTSSYYELRQRLTSPHGGSEMLARVESDDSVAYGVERLMKWVKADDNLRAEEKIAVGEAFLSYLYSLLLSPDDLSGEVPGASPGEPSGGTRDHDRPYVPDRLPALAEPL